ncbi:MAG: hypothetical protein AAF483_24535, partial [Planctomycetota bacterium]
MVRLRTDRWYTADGQKRSRSRVKQQGIGSRRLMSMCFLLALVILLMQRAADPKYISNAFRALGVPLEGAVAQGSESYQTSVEPEASYADRSKSDADAAEAKPKPEGAAQVENLPAAEEKAWQATVEDLVPRLLDSASETELEALATIWFDLPTKVDLAIRQARLAALNTNSLAGLKKIQASLADKPEDDPWAMAIAKFDRQWRSLWTQIMHEGVARNSSLMHQEFSDYLDAKLLDSLVDSSPWKKEENAVFNRLLDRCTADNQDLLFARVSTQNLEAEAMQLKGKAVRFRGEVRRVMDAKDAGKYRYWLVWLRGEDGAEQPVAAYVCDAVAQQWQDQLENEPNDFPRVDMAAISGKRLAYASVGGLEIAPTLFATQVDVLAKAEDTSQEAMNLIAAEDVQADFLNSLWLGVGLACLLLIPIWYQWRKNPGGRAKSKLEYRTPSGRSGSASLILFALLPLAISELTSSSDCWAQESPPDDKPPWAQEANVQTQRIQALESLLKHAMSGSAKEELDQFLFGETASFESFPSAILRVTQSVEKIGWQHLRSDASFDLGGDGEIRIWRTELKGFIRAAMPVSLSEEQKSWFLGREEEKFYKLAVLPEGENELLWVFARTVPRIWTSSAALYQPIRVQGLAIGTKEQSRQCLIAEDLDWSLVGSDVSTLKPQLSNEFLALGQAGWDLTAMELIFKNDQRALSRQEAEPFYSLIRLAGKE